MFNIKSETSNPILKIHKYRKILLSTTLNEIRANYSGSILGLAWTIFGPAVLITIYVLIYAVVFRIQPPNMSVLEYILYVVSGLIPFLGFSLALGAGTLSISTNKHYLLSTVFPAELVPIRTVISSNTILFLGIALIAALALFTQMASFFILLLPLVIIFQILFTIGIVWVFSLISLVFRDIQFMIQYIVLILLILTPISYTPEMIPPAIKIIAYLNPLFYFTFSFQSIIALRQLPPLSIVAGGIVISTTVFWAGYIYFLKAKAVIFDYV
ncbi:MAG: hypothetical protein DWQ07_09095 [Chloroflexi bacterium]|nr:MAG: hypothetical protein DWQ07_09095 [Chloroflexota bacterium]MBL1193132.1 hypothetical protein [Chloroflexota bacterium]NOH10425.1 ABC transporter permease [Chloroflexota bacterium]